MPRNNQNGFSLIELLISMVGMLVIVGAVFSLLSSSTKVATTTYEITEAQETLRIAHEWISRDLTSVGDGLSAVSNIRLPLSFVTPSLTLTPLTDPGDPATAVLSVINSDDNVPDNTPVSFTTPTVYVRSSPGPTDRIILLEADQTFTPIGLAANAIVPSGSNVSVSAADINRFQIGEIYFFSSGVGATFGAITEVNVSSRNLIFAAGDPNGLNQPGNGGPINVVSAKGTLATSLMRMQIVHYFVNSDGLLIRRVFGPKGAAWVDGVVAEHVVSLQFRYLLNLRDADQNVVQPVTQLTTSGEQLAVRGVEASITVETTRPINNGARQQITMTAATSVRNMQFKNALHP